MRLTRRSAVITAGMALLPFSRSKADDAAAGPPYADVTGQLPNLQFSMNLASTGAAITQADFAGHPVILYFGFTRCTDTCPLTMENAARLLRRMGPDGQRLRVLFVTIDPVYDSLAQLKQYLANFGPPPAIDGLRGSRAQLQTMARRFGVQYTAVTTPDTPDPVANISHSVAVYGFGPDGKARYILGTLAADKPDLNTVAQLMAPLVKA